MGGRATFYREDGQYRMKLVRGQVERTYSIFRTVGSWFFQYYVGQLIAGHVPPRHPTRFIDHLLPFGYWLDQKHWVPLVDVGGHQGPDDERDDPCFAQLGYVRPGMRRLSHDTAGGRLAVAE